MGLTFLWISLLTFILSLLLTWGLKTALKPRKKKVPEFGGISIFLSFWTGFFVLFPDLLWHSSQWMIFVASSIVLITGIIDDCFVLSAWKKSVGLLLAANVIYFLTDIQLATVFLPEMNPMLFAILTYILTIIWIYFVTNAVNLLDGVDGLASSVSAMSLLILTVTTVLFSGTIRAPFIGMLILLMMAILGFLPFNLPPAKIYLGDTGALFVGFMYASLGVSNLKNAAIFTMIVPVLMYAVPLFDSSYAIFRRILTGQSIVSKDQEHLHHRLLRSGFTTRQIILGMLAMTLVFGFLAILGQLFREWRWLIIFILLVIVLVWSYVMYRLGKKNSNH